MNKFGREAGKASMDRPANHIVILSNQRYPSQSTIYLAVVLYPDWAGLFSHSPLCLYILPANRKEQNVLIKMDRLAEEIVYQYPSSAFVVP
jgi:hypothetical protein